MKSYWILGLVLILTGSFIPFQPTFGVNQPMKTVLGCGCDGEEEGVCDKCGKSKKKCTCDYQKND